MDNPSHRRQELEIKQFKSPSSLLTHVPLYVEHVKHPSNSNDWKLVFDIISNSVTSVTLIWLRLAHVNVIETGLAVHLIKPKATACTLCVLIIFVFSIEMWCVEWTQGHCVLIYSCTIPYIDCAIVCLVAVATPLHHHNNPCPWPALMINIQHGIKAATIEFQYYAI